MVLKNATFQDEHVVQYNHLMRHIGLLLGFLTEVGPPYQAAICDCSRLAPTVHRQISMVLEIAQLFPCQKILKNRGKSEDKRMEIKKQKVREDLLNTWLWLPTNGKHRCWIFMTMLQNVANHSQQVNISDYVVDIPSKSIFFHDLVIN